MKEAHLFLIALYGEENEMNVVTKTNRIPPMRCTRHGVFWFFYVSGMLDNLQLFSTAFFPVRVSLVVTPMIHQ